MQGLDLSAKTTVVIRVSLPLIDCAFWIRVVLQCDPLLQFQKVVNNIIGASLLMLERSRYYPSVYSQTI